MGYRASLRRLTNMPVMTELFRFRVGLVTVGAAAAGDLGASENFRTAGKWWAIQGLNL